MSPENPGFPIIDLQGYLCPDSSAAKYEVIKVVADTCREYGFLQIEGHGIPIKAQRDLFRALQTVFDLPEKEKLELSFLNNPCRRGYEALGTTIRDGDFMGDTKECYYVGQDDPIVELSGFYGPNVWPDVPVQDFRRPVSEYYQLTRELGRTIWEVLLQGLGYSPSLVDKFAQRPVAPMKMCRYPPACSTLPEQHGAGPHTDFAGLSILLQEPGKHGLEVLHNGQWMPIPAQEDVIVVIVGDMAQRWTEGRYKSVRHRVVNNTGGLRHSCATFWQGDVFATNPLNDEDRETIGLGLVRRFRRQFLLDHCAHEVEDQLSGPAIDELDLGQDGQLVSGGCVVS